MGCQIHSPNLQLLFKAFNNYQALLPSSSSSYQSQVRNKATITSSSTSQQQDSNPSSAVATQTKSQTTGGVHSIKFKTLGGCKLGIARYPDFEYNADGGAGYGTVREISDGDCYGEIPVEFDIDKLYIPPLTTVTTKFLGLPLPPFLKIDIVPETFQGIINQESGKVDLTFRANFLFSVGNIYRAPPLLVETLLTTEESKGKMRNGKGQRLDKEGRCKLVGIATVDPIENSFLNTFLGLPTECVANLTATISFSST